MATQNNSQQPVAFQIKVKVTSSYYWLLNMLPYIVLCIILLTSCGLPGLDDSSDKLKPTPPPPFRIVANFTVARELQYCADTYPIVPDGLFKSGAALVSEMLDNSININEGEVRVFVSYIVGTDSYLKDAFSWSIDPIPDDPPEPSLTPTPNPSQVKGSSYDVANAQSTVQASNDAIVRGWYARLNANHALLSSARATMKRYTSRLRSLPNINSPSPESVEGCLQSASTRMAGFTGRKTIILSSPLAEDASVLPFIDLSGISVQVINWQCVFHSADVCIASRNAWEAKLLSFHASTVSIRDPQNSQVVKPSF